MFTSSYDYAAIGGDLYFFMKLVFKPYHKRDKNTHRGCKQTEDLKREKNKLKEISEHQRKITEEIKLQIKLKIKFTRKDRKCVFRL